MQESREQFERSAQGQISSFTREVEIREPLEIQFYEMHNYFTSG